MYQSAVPYMCQVCGYTYDPDKGDPENNVPKGTPFEKIPGEYTCPWCGGRKEDFNPTAEY